MSKNNETWTPSEAIASFMDSFREIYSGHEDFAREVFRRIVANELGIKESNKPVGCYMIVGPSGAGKSFFWESIAEVIHSKKDALVYMNGGEYLSDHEVSKIIGAPPSYLGYEKGTPALNRKLMDHAKAGSVMKTDIVLFDEVDKAHRRVQDVFLGAMERGVIKTGSGDDIDLKNALIVFTSNAVGTATKKGSFGLEGDKRDSINLREALVKDFSVPFLNRIDKFEIFAEYNREERVRVFHTQMIRILEDFGTFGRGFIVTEDFLEALADIPMSPKFGLRDLVRKMKNIVRDKCLDIELREATQKSFSKEDVVRFLADEHIANRRMQANVC